MSKIIKIGCETFVLKKGKLLLGIRKNSFGSGSWGLPSGHLEYGEKLMVGAKRELEEETGIKAEELTLLTVSDEVRSEDHYIHFGFLLDNFEGEAQLTEPDKCEKWEFFDLENLPENLFWPHKQLIENLKNRTLYVP